MFKNILVPIDGSAPSRRALKRAVRLAREQKARITGFYVGPAWRLPVYAEAAPIEVVSLRDHAAAVRRTANQVLGLVRRAAAAARVPFRCRHAMGDLADSEIVKAAHRYRCNLIVIASHGRRGFSRLLLGSVTNKVLAQSQIPVMVVR